MHFPYLGNGACRSCRGSGCNVSAWEWDRGTDGPTDAAGAVATWRTIECAVPAHAAHVGTRATKELSDASGVRLPPAFLANNDAYTYFDRAGRGLLKTGPTGTNVMDVTLALVDSVEEAS